MNYRMVSACFSIGLILMGSGCGRQARDSITIAGSTAFQPFAEKLAEQFMAVRMDVRITVQGGGSAVGIQAARSGAAQIGMADLVELPPEAGKLASTRVARDGIAVIVNPANQVRNLTVQQVRGIFSGTIRTWKEVGGGNQPIRVVSREAGSGTRSSFEQILGGVRLSDDSIIQDSNGTIRETVANDSETIGYLSHGLLNEKVAAMQVDGVDCTEAEILSGRYKLVRPVFLLTLGPPSGSAKDFIDYVLSVEGQETIKKNGLLPAQ